MRILGHIHTLNDEEVIEQSMGALLRQTLPLSEIVVVDNGSTDGTLAKVARMPATLLRHETNQGTSGAVITGMQYAIRQGFDWIWLFDADTEARPDALETLIRFLDECAPDVRESIWLLSSIHIEQSDRPYYQAVFSDRGFRRIQPDPDALACEFDSTIWSGSLYRLSAVQRIGLPSADYVLDWGEHEYGYRGKRSGLRAFLHQKSIVHHNIGAGPALHYSVHSIGPFAFRMRELPAIRCYYLVRNLLYFWLYECKYTNLVTVLTCFVRVAKLTGSFLLRARTRPAQLSACLRGIRDGVTRRIHVRY